MCVSRSVVSDSLRSHGVQPTRLHCLWNSPGKNTGVGSHSLLQGIFPTQGSKLGLAHCGQILYHLSHLHYPFIEVYKLLELINDYSKVAICVLTNPAGNSDMNSSVRTTALDFWHLCISWIIIFLPYFFFYGADDILFAGVNHYYYYKDCRRSLCLGVVQCLDSQSEVLDWFSIL